MLASELISAVRQDTDEKNTSDLTDAKVLSALNRAQQRLARLSVRHFQELLKRNYETTISANPLIVPDLSQAATITQVDVLYGSAYFPIDYTNTTNVVQLEGTFRTSSLPVNYAQQGNKLYFYPSPVSGLTVRVKYQLKPYKLVLEQGRITNFDTENGYLYLDAVGSSLTTSVSTLGAFINVIDQFTGDIKGTYQVSNINSSAKRLTIKSASLDRSTVYGLTVGTELANTIAQDDYVCLASGTCIPLYFREYTDFLTQFAVNEVKRTYGMLADTDAYALKDLEEDVKQMWASRPQGFRIQPRSPHWGRVNLFSKPRSR